jgi:transcriptional regulator GlxA family with amidase domain
MQRREFLSTTASVTAVMVTTMSLIRAATAEEMSPAERPISHGEPIDPPTGRKIRTLFAMADSAQVIDFAGPWEVFNNVHVHGRGPTMDEMMPFELSTVAATTDPIEASGGLKIIPDYTVENAPTPDLVVVPALKGNPALLEWLASVAPKTDVTMSVCTGSFQLAEAGLLDGLVATTHHEFYESFSKHYPQVTLKRDVRFVENRRISTAGGLTSGIDLALRVVERYFGRMVAQQTADHMEYTSTDWRI